MLSSVKMSRTLVCKKGGDLHMRTSKLFTKSFGRFKENFFEDSKGRSYACKFDHVPDGRLLEHVYIDRCVRHMKLPFLRAYKLFAMDLPPTLNVLLFFSDIL